VLLAARVADGPGQDCAIHLCYGLVEAVWRSDQPLPGCGSTDNLGPLAAGDTDMDRHGEPWQLSLAALAALVAHAHTRTHSHAANGFILEVTFGMTMWSGCSQNLPDVMLCDAERDCVCWQCE
jgi:hypothetical protein